MLCRLKQRTTDNRRFSKMFAACSIALAMAACGGNSGDDTDDDGGSGGETGNGVASLSFDALTVYGLDGVAADQVSSRSVMDVFTFQNDAVPGNGSIEAGALQFAPTGLILQDTIDFRNGEFDLDTCEIDQDDGGGGGGDDTNSTVDAGSFVTINSAAGTFLTIERNSDGVYAVTGLEEPLPQGATLSAPGQVFPTVTEYPLFVPAAPVRLSPEAGSTVGLDTEYSWQPDGDSTTYARLVFGEWDDSGSFVGFPMWCEMVDDGSFEVPDEVIGVIAGSENVFRVRYERVIRRLDYVDDIIFYQYSRGAGAF